MELKALSDIFRRQITDAVNMLTGLSTVSDNLSELVAVVGVDVNLQVKSLMGTANIMMQSMTAQNTLIQQTIDEIAKIVS